MRSPDKEQETCTGLRKRHIGLMVTTGLATIQS
jgi:hypothetical protein